MTSSLHLHTLKGCTPQPLAHYLKALGVLRLLAEQADSATRGLWRDGVFCIVTSLDEEELLSFFLERYRPTPLIAPWNGGSGFYPKDTKSGIDPISASEAPRFKAYAGAIKAARLQVDGADKSPKDDTKAALLAASRRGWRGPELEWLCAATVLAEEGNPKYPALLGTGGNDGRLDFTNNFMQRLVDLFEPETGRPLPEAHRLLAASLHGQPSDELVNSKIGQFDPGAAGGANSTSSYKGESLINPWDFVLMLEGSLVFQASVVRRLDGRGLPQASAPFALRGQAGGYASASKADESARGEQWLPLWSRPATYAEVQALFHEGRLQVGGRRAERALDAARAVAGLGVARGITSFQRYGYLERNGQSNLAVPLGLWPVQAEPRAALLGEIDEWVERLRRAADGKTAPAAFGRAARKIERAMFAVCEGTSASDWQSLLAELGAAEDMLAGRPKSTAESRLRPLPRLSEGWLDALDDGSAEVSLAAAIASQVTPAWASPAGPGQGLGPVRVHCLPIERSKGFWKFAATDTGLLKSPRVVWSGRDLVTDLAAVALRRAIEGARLGTKRFPLQGRCPTSLADLERFVRGEVDDEKIARLARGLMAIDWPQAPRSLREETEPWQPPSHLLALFKTLYAPLLTGGKGRRLRDLAERTPPLDAAPLRLLLAGRLDAAGRRAATRLRGSGAR
ncbi:MAG: type I-U CRISPR-associated protein Csx17, partial [Planctomycetes bacterium]|nr:type I-U CRISPR-associated protein Csx17 [Planctomycetota bacterium]